jgi:hypothetical protein
MGYLAQCAQSASATKPPTMLWARILALDRSLSIFKQPDLKGETGK